MKFKITIFLLFERQCRSLFFANVRNYSVATNLHFPEVHRPETGHCCVLTSKTAHCLALTNVFLCAPRIPLCFAKLSKPCACVRGELRQHQCHWPRTYVSTEVKGNFIVPQRKILPSFRALHRDKDRFKKHDETEVQIGIESIISNSLTHSRFFSLSRVLLEKYPIVILIEPVNLVDIFYEQIFSQLLYKSLYFARIWLYN